MKNKMTLLELKEYIRSEAKKLYENEILKEDKKVINEGWLSNIAGILGITLGSLTGVLGQTANDFEKLKKAGYDQEALNKIEMAMEDSTIQNKLQSLGVPDNNIQKVIKTVGNHKIGGVTTKTTKSNKELARLLRGGYSLTSIETDTLLTIVKKVAPDSVASEVTLTFGDNAFFQSGKFALNEKEIGDIAEILTTISTNGDQLIDVTIESSTDKQGLSLNLQNQLQTLGYSPNNQGLSNARNNAVKSVLLTQGVDASLIDQDIKFEQGAQIIEPNARYVRVIFHVLEINKNINPASFESNPEYVNTYKLIKANVQSQNTYKHKKQFKWPSCKIKISLFKKHHKQCAAYSF